MTASARVGAGVHDVDCAAAVAALLARRPDRIVPGLPRIRALSAALGDPQRAYPCVHVTGTNGKTSTARMVTALLAAAGRRVGTYTSPHLQDVRERVRIDGTLIGRDRFLAALTAVDAHLPAVEAAIGEGVTAFEALTALAAVCFRDEAVDVGVLEVGMGGRWDATNVHDSEVAIIGRVGLDHPELGSSIPEVAVEKAGIIKDGATVVVGPQQPAAMEVIADVAAQRGARLLRAGVDFGVLARLPVENGQDLVLDSGWRTVAVHLPLHGAHQATNAACALAGADAFLAPRGGLDPDVARTALARVRSPGRLEVVGRPGLARVVLDGAHNPEGGSALAAALDEVRAGRRVVAVVGVLADKDVEAVLAAVLPHGDAVILTRSRCERAAAPELLATLAKRDDVLVARDIDDALALADELAVPDDAIIVTGSLDLVGAARAALGVPVE